MLEAHITVIPKTDRDPTQAANYRPISLLNVDIKIFSKILANRLLPLLPSIVSHDQVGFLPGREARDNTLKAINLHHHITTSKQKGFFLSLDAEKVFDRVAWDYMAAVLQALGMKQHMLSLVMSLYAKPMARIRVNNTLWSAFSIHIGTRQGCPLSPILFLLTLEPLLCSIGQNPNIQGIRTNQREHKLAAYADDILLFLTSPHTTLPVLLDEFRRFSLISNLR